jgi:hypothetical protein
MRSKITEICETFKSITNIVVSVEIMDNPERHNPSRLTNGEMGVYVFYKNDNCFKVGKAGSKSKARWNSHHYHIDKGANSVLAKKIKNDMGNFKQYFPVIQQSKLDSMDDKDYNLWIKTNISRVELKLSSNCTKFELNLLEAISIYMLNPIYEG